MRSTYDEQEDVLDIQLNEKEYWKSIELADGVIMDISKDGDIIAFEILNASKVFSGDVKRVLESAQKTAA